MEEKNNIAKILKDKPQGTKLYADAFGELSIEEICTEDELGIILLSSVGDRLLFYNDGRFNLQGEPILVPSKEMRNWNKFSWKKGDVLVTENGAAHIIFEKFTDDTYTIFAGKCYYCKNGAKGYTYLRFSDNAITEEFTLETEDAAKTYISFIEKRLGGKLNRETLEIEKAQPEFKDGDIVIMHKKNCDIVFIFNRLRTEGSFYYYAFHALQTNNTGVIDCHTTLPCAWTFFEGKMNFATDSEKQQLFGALAKEGKAWDAKKKMLVELKTKIEFKPFDKVLVRNTDTEEWFPGFFEKFDRTWNYPYHIMNLRSMTDFSFKQCIPYEGNEHLLGTTKDVEG